MTLLASGGMTGQLIRDELRQVGGNVVFGDPTTRWLADKPTGSIVIPTDYYSKAAVKQTHAQSYVGSGSLWTPTVNLGVDFPGRRFVVCVCALAASTASQLLFLGPHTLAGAALTVGPGQAWFNPSTNVSGGIMYSVPSAVVGTSATLSIQFNQSVIRFRTVIYAISNIGTVFDTGFNGSASATSSSTNLNIEANGVAVAMAFKDQTTTLTLSGVVEDSDAGVGGNVGMVTGWQNRLAVQSNRPIGATGTGVAAIFGLAAVSFGT